MLSAKKKPKESRFCWTLELLCGSPENRHPEKNPKSEPFFLSGRTKSEKTQNASARKKS